MATDESARYDVLKYPNTSKYGKSQGDRIMKFKINTAWSPHAVVTAESNNTAIRLMRRARATQRNAWETHTTGARQGKNRRLGTMRPEIDSNDVGCFRNYLTDSNWNAGTVGILYCLRGGPKTQLGVAGAGFFSCESCPSRLSIEMGSALEEAVEHMLTKHGGETAKLACGKTHERQRNMENLLMDTHNECTTSRDPLTIHHKRRTNHRNSATAL